MLGGDSMLWEAGSDTVFEQSMCAVCNVCLAGKIGLVDRCWLVGYLWLVFQSCWPQVKTCTAFIASFHGLGGSNIKEPGFAFVMQSSAKILELLPIVRKRFRKTGEWLSKRQVCLLTAYAGASGGEGVAACGVSLPSLWGFSGVFL